VKTNEQKEFKFFLFPRINSQKLYQVQLNVNAISEKKQRSIKTKHLHRITIFPLLRNSAIVTNVIYGRFILCSVDFSLKVLANASVLEDCKYCDEIFNSSDVPFP
jgi:hypothetical protein